MPRVLWLSILAFVSACQQLTRIEGGEQACVPPAVQAAFDRSCARSGCHDAATASANLSLAAGASAGVLGRNASQQPLPLVTIGDPKGSYLAHKLMPAPPTPIVGARMPVGFDPTDEAQAADVGTILAWIAGAPFAGCDAGDTGVADTGGSDDGLASESSGGIVEASGLPCEIDELLARHCRSCHSDPPLGAPMSLVLRDDLLAATPSNAALSVAERAAERMADDAAPMPPAPGTRVSAAELAIFEDWIAAGAPAQACDSGGSDTGSEPEPNPFDADPICSSGRYWDDDDHGDPRMHPGRDCISCHTAESEEREDDDDDDDVPDLVIAGTIYPTGHEPNDCNGVDAVDLRVVVQSMINGDEVTLTPNTSGNFLLHRADAPSGFAPPFQVKLVEGERERIMPIPAPAGSCNGCHTAAGSMGAPGRIVRP